MMHRVLVVAMRSVMPVWRVLGLFLFAGCADSPGSREVRFDSVFEFVGSAELELVDDQNPGNVVDLLVRGDMIVLADRAYGALLAYDLSGHALWQRGVLGDGPGEFRMLEGIVQLEDGTLAGLDRLHRSISPVWPRISPAATMPVGAFSDAEYLPGTGHFVAGMQIQGDSAPKFVPWWTIQGGSCSRILLPRQWPTSSRDWCTSPGCDCSMTAPWRW